MRKKAKMRDQTQSSEIKRNVHRREKGNVPSPYIKRSAKDIEEKRENKLELSRDYPESPRSVRSTCQCMCKMDYFRNGASAYPGDQDTGKICIILVPPFQSSI